MTRRRASAAVLGSLVLGAAVLAGAAALAEEGAPPPPPPPATPAVAAPPAPPAQPARPVREVNLFVKEWTWFPDTVRVRPGTHLVLNVESVDASRSFVQKDYGLKVPLPQGQKVKVELDADKPGTFTFRCGRPCGNGCAKLHGTLIVQ